MPRPRGRSPISAVRVGVDAGGDETLELLPGRVEHADGGVARAGDVARDVEQLPQHRVDVERGHQEPASRVDQATKAEFVKRGLGHGGLCGNYGSRMW